MSDRWVRENASSAADASNCWELEIVAAAPAPSDLGT